MPLAPGTWGSLFAIAIVVVVHWLAPQLALLISIILIVVLAVPGVIFATQLCRVECDPDPSKIVIDEVVGQMLTLVWTPVTPRSLIAGFLLFRLFDIVKPFPARRSESLPGGWGVMCDDFIAAVYAGIALKISMFFMK